MLRCVVCAVVVSLLPAVVLAQPPGRPVPAESAHVSLDRERGGDPILLINYDWAVHAQASVEVRLVTGEVLPQDPIRPLYFQNRYFHGDTAAWVYKCQDIAGRVGSSRVVNRDGMDLTIVGRRNALGQDAVNVLRLHEGREATPGVSAAFVLLRNWSITPKLLSLDLPREEFAPAGRLHVWFLRDKAIVWHEAIAWPGYGAK